MKYDDILSKLGGWGRFQKLRALLIFYAAIPNGFFTMAPVFTLDLPRYHCNVSSVDAEIALPTEKQLVEYYNESIPLEFDSKNKEYWKLSSCKMYHQGNKSNVVMCENGWKYYPAYGENTAFMEWNIVCGRSSIKPMILAVFMAGVMTGSLMSGIISDRFGRRPTFLWSTLLQFLFMLLAGFSTNPQLYAAFAFFAGGTSLINYVSAYILTIELVPPNKRSLIGVLGVWGFAFGYIFLPLFAYFLTEWRWLYYAMGIGGIFYIPIYWLFPESPRWLLMNGKRAEGLEIIKTVAKVNKVDLTEEEFADIEKGLDCATEADIAKQFNYQDLFIHPVIRMRALIMFSIWFSASMIYYCISLSTSDLGGNKFINCFIAAALEFPANAVCFVGLEKFGRKKILIFFLTLAGAACGFASAFLSVSHTILVASAMTSKFACTIVFTLIYIFCCELFPTKMRNISLGACSCMARIGAIVAPYIIYAGKEANPIIPYLTMGGFAFVSAILTLFLPETLNAPLPDTVEDANLIRKSKKKYNEKEKPLMA